MSKTLLKASDIALAAGLAADASNSLGVAAVGCGLVSSSTQSGAQNAFLIAQFTDELFDTHGFANLVTSNTNITVPAGLGGLYLILVHARFTLGAPGDDCRVFIFRNGSALVPRRNELIDAGTYAIGFSAITPLSAGDVVTLRYQSVTYAPTLDQAELTVVRLGAI